MKEKVCIAVSLLIGAVLLWWILGPLAGSLVAVACFGLGFLSRYARGDSS